MKPTPVISPAVWIPAVLLTGALAMLLGDGESTAPALSAEAPLRPEESGTEPAGPVPTEPPPQADPVERTPVESVPGEPTATEGSGERGSVDPEPGASVPGAPQSDEPESGDPLTGERESTEREPDDSSPAGSKAPPTTVLATTPTTDPPPTTLQQTTEQPIPPTQAPPDTRTTEPTAASTPSESPPTAPVVDAPPGPGSAIGSGSGFVDLRSWDAEERVAAFERSRFLERVRPLLREAPTRREVAWSSLDARRPFVFFAEDVPPELDRFESVFQAWDRVRALGVLDAEAEEVPLPVLIRRARTLAPREGDELLPPSLLAAPPAAVQRGRRGHWLVVDAEAELTPATLRSAVHLGLRAALERQGLGVPAWWEIGVVEWACGVQEGRHWSATRLLAVDRLEEVLGAGRDWQVWTAPEAQRLVRAAGRWIARFQDLGDEHERAVAAEWLRELRAGRTPPAVAFHRERLGLPDEAALEDWWARR